VTPKFASHFTSFDIEDHNSPIDLTRIINADGLDMLALKRTRPEARKSPLRLNLRQVAWPDPDYMQSAYIDVAIATVNPLSLPVRASG